MTPVMATLALALSGSAVAAPPDTDTTLGLQPTEEALVLDQRLSRGGRGGSSQGARSGSGAHGAPAAGPHGAPAAGPQGGPPAQAARPQGGPPAQAARPQGGPPAQASARPQGAPSARPTAAPSSSGRPAGPPPQAASRPTTHGPASAPASSPHRPTPSALPATPAPSTARSNGQGHASHGGVGQGHVSHGNGNGYGHTGGPPSRGPSSPSRPSAAPVQPRHVQASAHPGYGSRPSPSAAPRHGDHHVPAHTSAPRHVRPHAAPRHTPHHVRPGPRVHHAPPRVVHHHAPPRVHHHHSTVVVRTHYPHVRPYHGVFVYGPAPVYHHQYVQSSGPVTVEEAHLPDRKIDRENSLAVGIRGGSFIGGYDTAAGFSDPGLGVAVRYRPDETVGLEVALSHYGMESDDSMRTNTVGQASVELFAWPWTRVSPYVLAGLTADGRNFDDDYFDTRTDTVQNLSTSDVQWGPHAGLGVEFALGKSVALDLEARYVGFLSAGGEDPTLPGAVQTSAGVMIHF